jgi:hypothetical protein
MDDNVRRLFRPAPAATNERACGSDGPDEAEGEDGSVVEEVLGHR